MTFAAPPGLASRSHHGHRADEDAAAEGDEEMAQFLFQPPGTDMFEARQIAAERNAAAGGDGQQQDGRDFIHAGSDQPAAQGISGSPLA
jgi:hypothetical protein